MGSAGGAAAEGHNEVRYYDNVVDLIGNTPLVRLRNVTAGIGATVLAKVEYFNPGGSVKDRIALRMVEEAEKAGLLQPGGTIVEPTSGNTGVGLALVAQLRGYRCVFVCPDKVSEDKQNVLRAYGAEVVVCPTAVAPEDPRSYYNVSDRLAREIPGAWKPNQYANPANPRSHYETTGPEVWEQTDGTDHALRGRRRHRRHDLRRRALPQGGVRRDGPDHRRRPGGLGLLRRHRPAVPGRGRRRGLLAGDVRPDDLRRDRRGLRQGRRSRSPAGWPARRVCSSAAPAVWRWRRRSRSPGAAGPDDVVVVLLPDGGRGYLSKIFNDDWMARYGFLATGGRGADRRRRPGRQERRDAGAGPRAPDRDGPRRDRPTCASTASRSCRCSRPSRPWSPARWPARSRRRTCSTRCSPARPTCTTWSSGTWARRCR